MTEILAQFARFCFRAVCHQNPNLLDKIGGVVVPLCPRCTGIYLGIFSAQLSLLVLRKHTVDRFPPREVNIACFILALPILVDWFSVHIGLRTTTLPYRFITGLLFGCIVGIYFTIYRNRNSCHIEESRLRLGTLDIVLSLFGSFFVGFSLKVLNNWTVTVLILLVSFLSFWIMMNRIFLLKINVWPLSSVHLSYLFSVLLLGSEILFSNCLRDAINI